MKKSDNPASHPIAYVSIKTPLSRRRNIDCNPHGQSFDTSLKIETRLVAPECYLFVTQLKTEDKTNRIGKQ